MLLGSNRKIVFIGDSITDCGRRGAAAPLGNGYVSLVHSLLMARYPALKPTIVNRGVDGDTVRDLETRWETDLIAEQPDWVSLKIGINDVWRFFGDREDQAVTLPEYTDTLRRLLERTKAATQARLILMTPYMIEGDVSHPMLRMMDTYGQALVPIAQEYDGILVDTQQAFDDVLAYTTPREWAQDQIHPNQSGHALLALAWLKAIHFEM